MQFFVDLSPQAGDVLRLVVETEFSGGCCCVWVDPILLLHPVSRSTMLRMLPHAEEQEQQSAVVGMSHSSGHEPWQQPVAGTNHSSKSEPWQQPVVGTNHSSKCEPWQQSGAGTNHSSRSEPWQQSGVGMNRGREAGARGWSPQLLPGQRHAQLLPAAVKPAGMAEQDASSVRDLQSDKGSQPLKVLGAPPPPRVQFVSQGKGEVVTMAPCTSIPATKDDPEASNVLAPYLISLYTQDAVNAGTTGQVFGRLKGRLGTGIGSNAVCTRWAPLSTKPLKRGSKHSVEVLLADMDAVDALELMIIKGGTGAGNAPQQPDEAPRHAAGRPVGGWDKFKGAMKSGAEAAAAAAALQPEAWKVQHAEVLQQDTGET
ncbi:hypothetical protein DUNSADRAFT_2104, partial [Dunaliella salina]